MLLTLISERLPFCVTQLVLFHFVSALFFWNQLTVLSERCLYYNNIDEVGEWDAVMLDYWDLIVPAPSPFSMWNE
jgi:hypothetical protein